MKTWHIHIKGQVQGVGFRPFVYNLAQQFELKGWVNNTVDGVHIVFNADVGLADHFKQEIIKHAPQLARIIHIQLTSTEEKFFDNFQIIHSTNKGSKDLLLTPDFGMCTDCWEEVNDPNDRRYQYAFTTCTNCGPRYSIIKALPYDREHTAMAVFPMCVDCQMEYDTPTNRRYYSQTNSCPNCAIQLSLYNKSGRKLQLEQAAMLSEVVHHWEVGDIVAIKGIGGYLLTCDATNEAAVATLRVRKHRPSKPFALMYPGVAHLTDFQLSTKERQALESPVASIVLLSLKHRNQDFHQIAPHLNRIGVMLPYTPLYALLLQHFGRAIVATSGNVSQSPIVFEDEKALRELTVIADAVLTNNRAIVVPQDDSVVQFTPTQQRQIILRRSRGWAPTYIQADLKLPKQNVLAMGAMLKSTFSICQNDQIYVSQYLGDLIHFDTQQNYQYLLQHFQQLLEVQPKVILHDKHLQYPSTILGKELAATLAIPVKSIQHHVAHFGAVLGEHNLVESKTPVLGVIWDGTGLGDDGQIWGGEFFTYDNYQFSRAAHFDYFDSILGDKMPKEPRISALSIGHQLTEAENYLKEKFSKTEWRIYNQLLQKPANLRTSSVGRIFDGVASLLGILDRQTYEGEAAMQLEAIATNYCQHYGLEFDNHYFMKDRLFLLPSTLFRGIIADLKAGEDKYKIAAKFHFSMVESIRQVASNLNLQQIAFSGGVFQNGLLVDLIHHHLSDDFRLYFHQQLCPNDENISFGQVICYQIEQRYELKSLNKKKKEELMN